VNEKSEKLCVIISASVWAGIPRLMKPDRDALAPDGQGEIRPDFVTGSLSSQHATAFADQTKARPMTLFAAIHVLEVSSSPA
jgi:hypothetical protein